MQNKYPLGMVLLWLVAAAWLGAQVAFWVGINIHPVLFFSLMIVFFVGAYLSPSRLALVLTILFVLSRSIIAAGYFAFSGLVYQGIFIGYLNIVYVLLGGLALLLIVRRREFLRNLRRSK
ncbi:MAG TPA: hypothetical protein VGE59_01480 [Patescibacteria group bacterium]